MFVFLDTILYKIRFVLVGTLVIASLLLLPFLPKLLWIDSTAHAADSKVAITNDPGTDDSPNVITKGVFTTAEQLNRVSNTTEKFVDNGFHAASNSIASATAFIGATVLQTGHVVVHAAGSGVGLTVRVTTGTLTFVGHTAGKTASLISNMTHLGDIISPAKAETAKQPVINADAFPLDEAHGAAATPQIKQAVPRRYDDSTAQWPIHGAVTLEFGASDWPFQRVHTGIDISDGRIGVTPIHSFKPGTVLAVVHSYASYGNHVIVNNGNGITSLYGHMSSISVHVGQSVDKNTILGYEGSTGASTGSHVHFEIRQNGRSVNPRSYIKGQP